VVPPPEPRRAKGSYHFIAQKRGKPARKSLAKEKQKTKGPSPQKKKRFLSAAAKKGTKTRQIKKKRRQTKNRTAIEGSPPSKKSEERGSPTIAGRGGDHQKDPHPARIFEASVQKGRTMEGEKMREKPGKGLAPKKPGTMRIKGPHRGPGNLLKRKKMY